MNTSKARVSCIASHSRRTTKWSDPESTQNSDALIIPNHINNRLILKCTQQQLFFFYFIFSSLWLNFNICCLTDEHVKWLEKRHHDSQYNSIFRFIVWMSKRLIRFIIFFVLRVIDIDPIHHAWATDAIAILFYRFLIQSALRMILMRWKEYNNNRFEWKKNVFADPIYAWRSDRVLLCVCVCGVWTWKLIDCVAAQWSAVAMNDDDTKYIVIVMIILVIIILLLICSHSYELICLEQNTQNPFFRINEWANLFVYCQNIRKYVYMSHWLVIEKPKAKTLEYLDRKKLLNEWIHWNVVWLWLM